MTNITGVHSTTQCHCPAIQWFCVVDGNNICFPSQAQSTKWIESTTTTIIILETLARNTDETMFHRLALHQPFAVKYHKLGSFKDLVLLLQKSVGFRSGLEAERFDQPDAIAQWE